MYVCMYVCMYSHLLLFIMLYLGYLGSKGRDKPSSIMRNLTFELICVSANSASSTKISTYVPSYFYQDSSYIQSSCLSFCMDIEGSSC